MSRTALIVVDMVKDFTQPDGAVFYPENRQVLPRIVEAVNRCRTHGVLIIYMRHSYRRGKVEKNLAHMRPCCMEGTGGDELDPLLPVDEETDYVIKKRRFSAFFGTDLEMVLRENGVENLIIVGTKTNCCIRATVTDAHYLGYEPIVLRDCVATNSDTVNQVHLEDIQKYMGSVITSQELFSMLEEGRL